MRKKMLFLLMAFLLVSCSGKGKDFSEVDKSKIQWSYLKSPNSGKCYEVMTHQVSGVYNPVVYFGMAAVDDKYCR